MRNVHHIQANGARDLGLPAAGGDGQVPADPLEPLEELFRDLRATATGLSSREAARRLEVSGPNELVRRGGRRWPGELARQFTHPLALLLAAAAGLAWASGAPRLAVAIVAVILLNASFSFVQELQAERAVEAPAAFLPERARVLRDGSRREIEARLLVPGDVLLIEEGERVCADARLMSGTVEVDMSTLTGESVPVIRSADDLDGRVPLLQARDVVFSGSECTGGEAQAVVTATGMGTELGRIAALSQRVGRGEPARAPGQAGGPADRAGGGRRGPGVPAGRPGRRAEPGRGDQLRDRAAGGERPRRAAAHDHARAGGRGARDGPPGRPGQAALRGGDAGLHLGHLHRQDRHPYPEPDARHQGLDPGRRDEPGGPGAASGGRARVAGRGGVACSTAELAGSAAASPVGDPTEVALLELAAACGLDVSAGRRDATRRALFRFDPRIKLMTTVDQQDDGLVVHTKGAPEEVLARARRIRRGPGEQPITVADRADAARAMDDYARQGLQVLAFGRRTLPAGVPVPGQREDAERDLCLIGLVAMLDPPRSEVPAAIGQVHRAGIRVHVVTGDNGLTPPGPGPRSMMRTGRPRRSPGWASSPARSARRSPSGPTTRPCGRSACSATSSCWAASRSRWPSPPR